MAFSVRVKPETADTLRRLAEKLGKTPGQWLDMCLAPAGSALIAHKLALVRAAIQHRRQFCIQAAKDLRKTEPDRAGEMEVSAEALAEALRMVEEEMEVS